MLNRKLCSSACRDNHNKYYFIVLSVYHENLDEIQQRGLIVQWQTVVSYPFSS